MIGRILPLFAVGLLAACGSSGGDTQVAADTTTSTTTSTEPLIAADPTGSATEVTADDATEADSGSAVVAAPEALQFSAPLVGGGDIELTTLAGRPVLLWFWAPW